MYKYKYIGNQTPKRSISHYVNESLLFYPFEDYYIYIYTHVHPQGSINKQCSTIRLHMNMRKTENIHMHPTKQNYNVYYEVLKHSH